MLHLSSSNGCKAAITALAVLALIATPALAGTVKEQRSFNSESLTVRNLIGEITVEGHSGSDFEVDITIQGKDATSGLISIDDSDDQLDLKFPSKAKFVYPRLGKGSRTKFSVKDGDNDWLGALLSFGRDSGRIEVSGTGPGVEVWADLKIRVPAGKTLTVKHGVGTIDIQDVGGEGRFSTRSGAINASGLRGTMMLDTGSGHVVVKDVEGELSIDTGSGHVEGSQLSGDRISIDTGSGHVELDEVDARRLSVDTGSGRVTASRISADSAVIDTGSGGVELALDRMGDGDFRIDTGSGGIRLRLPEGVNADVHAETGSGGIDVDLGDAVTMKRMKRDEASFTIGSGGAKIDLDTGSGGIRISR